MTSEEQDIADAVEAKLRRHDPRQWEVSQTRVPNSAYDWYCIHRNSNIVLFKSEEAARRFQRTGFRGEGK